MVAVVDVGAKKVRRTKLVWEVSQLEGSTVPAMASATVDVAMGVQEHVPKWLK